ncbi:transglycosylase SLT domain-containing protein [Endozoicomonas sp. SM1973]|uniref:Transglycosylase SLT domain-containing protein n=1 Tax=Spartinivicinus marinus TaxID=2994442 RepID=A0A853IDL5_9GAMM|nr:transglycosylase SLT domain-containing protein [Spartinivicinus marinus]MCX4028717.1 transglycosylase SLT domain-containing protein [Spartinivicinus marinus]NYZ68021.1 transglycosylase SLT domain-containing protein [Spartinivicinus marinus]
MLHFGRPTYNAFHFIQWKAVKLLLCLLGCLNSANVAASAQQLPDAEMRAYLKNTIAKADSFHDRFDAEVWLVDMSGRLKRYVKDHKKRLEILRLVHKEASQAGLQPELVLSVIHVESLFNHFAISRVGAQGLMQVMPFWKKEIGRPNDNLTDIATNIRYGCTILSYYLKKEKGNLTRALARYNGSLGKTWYPSRVFTAWNRFWQAR